MSDHPYYVPCRKHHLENVDLWTWLKPEYKPMEGDFFCGRCGTSKTKICGDWCFWCKHPRSCILKTRPEWIFPGYKVTEENYSKWVSDIKIIHHEQELTLETVKSHYSYLVDRLIAYTITSYSLALVCLQK